MVVLGALNLKPGGFFNSIGSHVKGADKREAFVPGLSVRLRASSAKIAV